MNIQFFSILIFGIHLSLAATAQSVKAQIRILDGETDQPVPFSIVKILPAGKVFAADSSGKIHGFESQIFPVRLQVFATGYFADTLDISEKKNINIRLRPMARQLKDVVVSGNLQEVNRMESTSPVEVYTPALFRKSWNPGLLESVNMINGVQPQLNCNVCNTGDIHIQGLEGPYTLVLIDGMPIVSSLSSVYGLSGIPLSLIKRIEIVKGPASTLYGSEAMGGLVNVITQDPSSAPIFQAAISGTSIGEVNSDISAKWRWKETQNYLGFNGFWYQNPKDKNKDGFTDLALNKRLSLFWKTDFGRKTGLKSSMVFRVFAENRWGGQMEWNPRFAGSDSIYGETIETRRIEILGRHQFDAHLTLQLAANGHNQNSWYGTTPYRANQWTGFGQLIWNKNWASTDWLLGVPMRYQYYDDNSVATENQTNSGIQNKPALTFLPGIFVQSDSKLGTGFSLLAGLRLDYHQDHGKIFTPRLALKKTWNTHNTLRLSGGSGFRVVNLFTEDHAALSGSRKVVILNDLKPEQSWNINLNFNRYVSFSHSFAWLDIALFYTRFSNQIVADYTTNVKEIRYDNLLGYGVSRGISVNWDMKWENGLSVLAGSTFMQVFRMLESGDDQMKKETQMFAPQFSGTLAVTYRRPGKDWSIDLTGRLNGPMRLPVLVNDFRPEYSPTYAIVNVQWNQNWSGGWTFFAGVKNLLNFIPAHPLMRPFDPFNKQVDKDNPYGYTFDTAYNYAPIQGITLFSGLKWTIQ